MLDARDPPVFAAGHIPHSANVPWKQLLRREQRNNSDWEEWKVEGEDGTYSTLPTPREVDVKLQEVLGVEKAIGIRQGSVAVTNCELVANEGVAEELLAEELADDPSLWWRPVGCHPLALAPSGWHQVAAL